MKCARCDNPISDIHNVEVVDWGGEKWEMAYATIGDNREMLCARCERTLVDLACRQIIGRNEQELANGK